MDKLLTFLGGLISFALALALFGVYFLINFLIDIAKGADEMYTLVGSYTGLWGSNVVVATISYVIVWLIIFKVFIKWTDSDWMYKHTFLSTLCIPIFFGMIFLFFAAPLYFVHT